MKNNKLNAVLFTAVLAYALTGCTGDQTENTPVSTTAAVTNAVSSEVIETTAATTNSTATSAAASTDSSAEIPVNPVSYSSAVSAIDTASIFSDRDLRQTADLTDAKSISLSDGGDIQITEAGIYLLSGSAKNCTVTVNADKEAKVQLVLDGVSVTNSDFPAIYVISADKVFVTTAENSENSLTVTGTFRADGETKTDAVIFSKADLVLNGTGSLQIQSDSGNGVTSKDDLKVTGGAYTLKTALDSLEANDLIAIAGGSFTIDTQKDALHCDSYVYIKDGNFTVNAKSDAIQADVVVQIDGGSMALNCAEGIESTYVQINGGTISINASDDGINAAQKCEGQTPTVEITDGDLKIVMGQGDTDAIDANGYIKVSGGKIDITAPMMSFDYDAGAEFTGGTIIINGEEVSEIPKATMGGRGGFGGFGGRGGQMPNGEMPSEGFQKPQNGQMPEGFTPPENGEMPQGGFRKRSQNTENGSQNSGSGQTGSGNRMMIPELERAGTGEDM